VVGDPGTGDGNRPMKCCSEKSKRPRGA
jgi:hypothetical protein